MLHAISLVSLFLICSPALVQEQPSDPKTNPVKEKPIVTKTAWGNAVDGVEYGFEFKGDERRYRMGQKVTFVLKARNMTDKPVAFKQSEVTSSMSSAIGFTKQHMGWTEPKIVDSAGKKVAVQEGISCLPHPAPIKTVKLAPRETMVLGELSFTLGKYGISVEPGTVEQPRVYRVHFDTVCWLPGHQRPTGTLEFEVVETTAWGKAVEGVEYGFEFKGDERRYRLGQRVTVFLKARNTTDKPVAFEQVEVTEGVRTAIGFSKEPITWATVPKIVDSTGKKVAVMPGFGCKPLSALIKTVKLAPGETTVLGELSFKLGDPGIPVEPGTVEQPRVYRVHFDTVCWLPGHHRPTGTLEMFVTDPTAWGKAVDGIEYGFEFKGDERRYRMGQKVTFVLKARNKTDKPVAFEQSQVTQVMSIAIGFREQVIGVTEPKIVDSAGKKVGVIFVLHPGQPQPAPIKSIKLAASETTVLGEIWYTLGYTMPGILVEPGTVDEPRVYRVRFDTVCWLPGHIRPTGTMEFVVLPTVSAKVP